VSSTNPIFRSADAQFRSVLSGYGVASTPSRRSDLAMLSQIVNNQATMMAYNDCFWLMAVMLIAVLPFLFLLPKTGVPQEGEAVVE
jgi:DHA2 family multidrug resistance protein